jgi:hypothetical protein
VDSTTDGNLTFFDAATDADAAFQGAPNDPDAALDGGGAFTCVTCTCNGAAQYCTQFADGDMADAGDGGCELCPAYPPACAQDHTCKCLLAYSPGPCVCGLDPSGNGLVVTCFGP